MRRQLSKAILLASLVPSIAAAQQRFTSSEHNISLEIPVGWTEVQGISESTVVKLSRGGPRGAKARIAVMWERLSEDRQDAHVWSLTNNDIRANCRESRFGETVDVKDVGRSTLDGVAFIWCQAMRRLPSGPELWEFTYQGTRAADALTIRLTAVGDEDWFSENHAAFAAVIRSLRLKSEGTEISHDREIVAAPSAAGEAVAVPTPPAEVRADLRESLKSWNPPSFWSALAIAFGVQYLKTLGAVCLVAAVAWFWKGHWSPK